MADLEEAQDDVAATAMEEESKDIDSETNDYRLFGSPVYRTPLEAAEDPEMAMIVVLADEGTLGQIVALPAPHNHIPQGRNRPLPNTAAVKQWFRDLVRTHCRTVGAEFEPQATPNPPLAENVMIFHMRTDIMHVRPP